MSAFIFQIEAHCNPVYIENFQNSEVGKNGFYLARDQILGFLLKKIDRLISINENNYRLANR